MGNSSFTAAERMPARAPALGANMRWRASANSSWKGAIEIVVRLDGLDGGMRGFRPRHVVEKVLQHALLNGFMRRLDTLCTELLDDAIDPPDQPLDLVVHLDALVQQAFGYRMGGTKYAPEHRIAGRILLELCEDVPQALEPLFGCRPAKPAQQPFMQARAHPMRDVPQVPDRLFIRDLALRFRRHAGHYQVGFGEGLDPARGT
jgi:hypothetical protein